MKLIDEKGKLFGKLNIIDLLVLLVLVAAVAFVGMRLAGRGQGGGAAAVEIEYTVLVTEAYPETYETICQFVDAANGKSDQLMANGELLSGYVIDCVATPHVTYVETADGSVVPVESTGEDARLDLLFTCRATITDTIGNKVGTQEVRAGMPHILKTTHFEFQKDATILSVNWLDSAA